MSDDPLNLNSVIFKDMNVNMPKYVSNYSIRFQIIFTISNGERTAF